MLKLARNYQKILSINANKKEPETNAFTSFLALLAE